MKLRFVLSLVLLATLLVGASINIAKAQWPAITTGYAITTNWHGIDTPLGSTVVATAGTTDLSVDTVKFVWHFPDNTTAFEDTVTPLTQYVAPAVPSNVPQELIDWANAHPGTTYLVAQDSHVVNLVGDWGVQAFFKDDVRVRGLQVTSIRAASFNVVPEVPLGTIVILASMFAALGIFAVKKRTANRILK
jgi:hypothetical protein